MVVKKTTEEKNAKLAAKKAVADRFGAQKEAAERKKENTSGKLELDEYDLKQMTAEEIKKHKQQKARESWLHELEAEKSHNEIRETEEKKRAADRKEVDEGSGEIKALIFDFGGVIVDNKLNDILTAFAKKIKVSPEEIIKLNLKHHDKMVLGKMSVKEFCSEVRARFALELESYILLSMWDKSYEETAKPNFELLEKIKGLRKGYHTALLTNIYDSTAQFESRRGTFWPFKTVQLSCRVGLVKPDIKAYARLIHSMGVKGKECVFIDDNEANIATAKEFGFITVKYKNNSQLLKELKSIGVNTDLKVDKVKKVKTWPN